MFQKQEWLDWRNQDITQELMKTISENANDFVAKILNRRESNPLDDQYLKGVIQGLSIVAGWTPVLITDEGETIPDEA